MISLADIQWVDTHTHKNTQYVEIENSFKSICNHIEHTQQDYQRYKEKMGVLEEAKNIWEAFDIDDLNNFPQAIKESLRAHVRYKKRAVCSDFNGYAGQVGRIERTLNEFAAKKVEYQFQLSKQNNKELVIDTDTINNTILKDHPHLSRFRMFTKNGILHYMFVVDGIKAKVDENVYPLLNNGEDVEIPIATSIVIVSNQGTVYVFHPNACRSYQSTFWNAIKDEFLENAATNAPLQRYYTNNVTHPHILGGFEACLGGFGVPIAEALAEGDIITVFSVVQMFLRSIAFDDAAGRKYIYYQNKNPIQIRSCVHYELGRLHLVIKAISSDEDIYRYSYQVGRHVKIFNGEITYGEYVLRRSGDNILLPEFHDSLKKRFNTETIKFIEADFDEYEYTTEEVTEAFEKYFNGFDVEMTISPYVEENDDEDEDY